MSWSTPDSPSRATVVPIEDRGVLLETGFAGGYWPSEMVEITPMLCAPLGIHPGEYEDTTAFDIQALKPARTLLEKLSLLHHVAAVYLAGEEPDGRCGRHYYDIYRLLNHRPTREALENRPQFDRMMSEMEEISAQTSARGNRDLMTAMAKAPPSHPATRRWGLGWPSAIATRPICCPRRCKARGQASARCSPV